MKIVIELSKELTLERTTEILDKINAVFEQGEVMRFDLRTR